MYESMTDDELQNLIADALRNDEKRAEGLDEASFETALDWAAMERRLEAYEREHRLYTSCPMRQLRKIVQMARDMKYYLLGKCWAKC